MITGMSSFLGVCVVLETVFYHIRLSESFTGLRVYSVVIEPLSFSFTRGLASEEGCPEGSPKGF